MSDTRMTQAEREDFLAGLHVGVLSIPRADRAPLAAPIWYGYEPGGEIVVLTGPDSLKGRLLEVGAKVSMVAQREAPPYAYVSVEGTVTAAESGAHAEALRALAHRYLGPELGDQYASATGGRPELRVSIRPERWLTVDYAKASPL
ncbi:MAG: pyridoxamine 5'-phosphate oxidase family protein [Pseudomonadales bacterium]|jgi:PPOX class probable F420-dependent enzyme|nr:pyridoxamine 5'-phosphate oxidase family protein [Pseudomonadales bacterium]